MNDFKNLAIQYGERALKLNKTNARAYIILAEAYALRHQDEDFYSNLELALQYGFPVWEQIEEPAYEKYRVEDRFNSLIKKYKW